jgi:hypothetical protein
MAHTSRKGWLARVDCFPENPIASDVNAASWLVARRGPGAPRKSLREIAVEIFDYFARSIARVSDPFSFRLIRAVLTGRELSLLDMAERPAAYDDVGHLCTWERFYSGEFLQRSRFERVVMHALSGDRLRIDGDEYIPTGMHGWSHIVFRRDTDGRRVTMPLDDLIGHLVVWDKAT